MLFLMVALALMSPTQVSCRAIPYTARIQSIGRFSDIRYTEEHAYGHAVTLWRGGDCVFGLFENSEGPAGDTPTGLLKDTRHTVGSWSYRELHPIQAAADSRLRQELVHLTGWTYRWR